MTIGDPFNDKHHTTCNTCGDGKYNIEMQNDKHCVLCHRRNAVKEYYEDIVEGLEAATDEQIEEMYNEI